MTAVNVFVMPDLVHVMTDGAWCRPDGMTEELASKTMIEPHLNAVLTSRGSAVLSYVLQFDVRGRFASFDDLVQGIVPALREGCERAKAADTAHGPDFELYIAGWSESRGKPEAWFVSNEATGFARTPWTVSPLPARSLAPMDPKTALRLAWNRINVSDGFRPEVDGVAIMREQRKMRTAEGAGAIGGFCQITTIRRDEISVRIVHRWPEDRIGERVGG